MRTPPSTFLFVAHDPGAKNHLGPLHRHAVQQGYSARFIDLARDPTGCTEASAIAGVLKAGRVVVLVTGCSTNRAEWAWIRAAKATGASSAMIIDIGIGTCLDNVDPIDAPDTFLVTNDRCVRELEEKGFRADCVRVTGNPYLESLANSVEDRRRLEVPRAYGVDPGRAIISMFLPPEGLPDGVIDRVHALLEDSSVRDWVVIVRPHPRTAGDETVQARNACGRLSDVVWDGERVVDTTRLLGASLCSLTLGSTVSAESWALGVPSAFFQIGWDYGELDDLYRNLDRIPRLRSAEAFHRFIADAAPGCPTTDMRPIERISGATASAWQVLYDLLQPGHILTS